jgi:hypothetical protein
VEAGVDAGQVEGGRVEVRWVFEADPLKHFLMLLVGRVDDRLLQVGVTPGTAAVLGRAGPFPTGAAVAMDRSMLCGRSLEETGRAGSYTLPLDFRRRNDPDD